MKLKSHFVMSKADRNGILIFIIMLLLIFGGLYFQNQKPPEDDFFEIDQTTQKGIHLLVDSLKKEQNKPYVRRIYPFNPNFISDEKSYRLEMTPAAYERLQAYRESNQWINSVDDFQEVTGVSDAWIKKYATYFKFPDWVVKQREEKQSRNAEVVSLSKGAKKDLNTVQQADLMQISGIGESLSRRILRYRSKIGGFRGDIQIKDIYGLSAEVEAKLLAQMTVKSGETDERLAINTASVIELTEVPYFDYELAREINTFIKLREGIESLEELSKIEDFKAYQIPQLKLYLKL